MSSENNNFYATIINTESHWRFIKPEIGNKNKKYFDIGYPG